MVRVLATAILAGCLIGCTRDDVSTDAGPRVQAVSQVETDNAIQIALIRYLVVEGGDQLSGGRGRKTACIGIATDGAVDSDPSEDVLRHFRGHRPPIRPASECQYVDEDPVLSYRGHVPTGDAAIGYTIGMESIEYEEDQALVRVTYSEASLSAGIWDCVLRDAETGWVVEQCTGSAVS